MSRCRCRVRASGWSGWTGWSVRRRRCLRSRRRGRCIGRGRPSWSGAGRGRCGCSRRRRPRRRGRSWGRDGSRPTIVIARRWSGWRARAPGVRALASGVEAMLAAVSHRRQLVLALKPLRQRLHDQLNALAPGLSAPAGHGRRLPLETPTGRAVLACAAAFAGRAPSARSLKARADGRLSDATAAFWAERWKQCLAPPADAELRAARLARDLDRFAGAAGRHRVRRRPARAAARRQRRPGPDQPARRRDRPRRGVCRAHAADRALRDARAALLGDRPGAGQLRVRQRPPTRRRSRAPACPSTATR